MKHQTPPNSPKLFEYSPLKAGEIRLLKLQSTDGGASSVICGELITRDLSKSNSKTEYDYNHEYEALSYVWGDESASCQIRLDDCHFHIRPNLAVALRSLSRQSPMERLLWIDAICINQADNAEKNLQVKQMGLIFQQAKGVLIWINSPGVTVRMDVDVQTRHAFRDFARHHSAGRDPKRLADILDSPRPSVLYDYAQEGGHWPALVRFFDQDWWQRVWVRQEIAMSQEATVLCGYQSVNWERVAALSHWLNLFMSDLDDKTRKFGARHRSGAYSGEDLQDFRQTLQRGGDLDFQTMIIHARNCEATDPRDRVFAVLGMVKDDGDISPDYNLTPAEVAKQAFQRLATLNDGLDALIFSQNPSRREGIPSWAPDIYSKFSAQPSRMLSLIHI